MGVQKFSIAFYGKFRGFCRLQQIMDIWDIFLEGMLVARSSGNAEELYHSD